MVGLWRTPLRWLLAFWPAVLACSGPPQSPHSDAGVVTDGAVPDADTRDDAILFSDQVITQLELELTNEAVAALRNQPREWTCAVLRHESREYAIGLRLKGSASFQSIDRKPAFKIRFDGPCGSDARLLGRSRLTLNNLVQDRSMVREVLAYQVFRAAGVPAPRAGFAEVILNGLTYGLYANIEDVDQAFLARHFDDASGPLYEGDVEVDVQEDDLWAFELDEGPTSRYELARLINRASHSDDSVFYGQGEVVAAGPFTRFLAASAVVGDWDGYWKPNNYRLYFEPSSKTWHFVPWGLDQTWYQDLYPFDGDSVLARKCMRSARCLESYIADLAEVADIAEGLDMSARLGEWLALIEDAAARDARRPYQDDDMYWSRRALPVRIDTQLSRLRQQLGCMASVDQGPDAGPVTTLDFDQDGFLACTEDCDDADAARHPLAEELCNGIDDDCDGLIDDAAECPCLDVEVGASFAICSEPRSWPAARMRCQTAGGDLAYLDDPEQNFALWQTIRTIGGTAWHIGINDRDLEDEYRWANGAVPAFIRWHWTEPNNFGEEDCGELSSRGDASWNDIGCQTERPFICRLPAGAAR